MLYVFLEATLICQFCEGGELLSAIRKGRARGAVLEDRENFGILLKTCLTLYAWLLQFPAGVVGCVRTTPALSGP